MQPKEYLSSRIDAQEIARGECLYPLFIFAAAIFIAGFRIANQHERGVVFRLGRLPSEFVLLAKGIAEWTAQPAQKEVAA